MTRYGTNFIALSAKHMNKDLKDPQNLVGMGGLSEWIFYEKKGLLIIFYNYNL